MTKEYLNRAYKHLALWAFAAIHCTSLAQVESTHVNLGTDFWATYYYIPQFDHDSTGVAMQNGSGQALDLRLDSCDWCQAAIEGTCSIRQGDTSYILTYAGRSDTLQQDCRTCPGLSNFAHYRSTGRVQWQHLSGYGRGVRNFRLVPFRTLAVDTAVIPMGTVVYIPEAVGARYTDTEGTQQEHDGYFFAGDVGAAIQGKHLDVFLGLSANNPFDFVRSTANHTFQVYRVLNPDPALLELHEPR